MLTGPTVRLRAVEEGDLATLASWRSDPEHYDHFYEFVPISAAAQRAWFDAQRGRRDEINFAAQAHDGTLVGTVSLVNIDARSRRGELGRVLVGHADYRGRGCGAEMIGLALEYGFDHLNLNKIVCEVLAHNERAAAAYVRAGFRVEGTLRDHVYKRGGFVDVDTMALFQADWRRAAAGG